VGSPNTPERSRPAAADAASAAVAVCVPSDCRCRSVVAAWPDGPDGALTGQLAHLYLCEELSTYAIGLITGMNRQRVTRRLHHAGIPLRPRGAGRPRPEQRQGDPPELDRVLEELYLQRRLTTQQIAVILAMPERTVRARLRRYGIRSRTRGNWNREHRRTIPADVLRGLYIDDGLTADEVARRLGTSRKTVLRNAHDLGLPVRPGGAYEPGSREIELINALYADRAVSGALAKHKVPPVPAGTPIWVRFPEPVPLSVPLMEDLYWRCGTGVHHIELLTGQPTQTILGFMRRHGVAVRHPGGRSPFMRRWHAGTESAFLQPADSPSPASPAER
jgi:DNA-binding CsgD family transcriptional regulator